VEIGLAAAGAAQERGAAGDRCNVTVRSLSHTREEGPRLSWQGVNWWDADARQIWGRYGGREQRAGERYGA
jgi:hypothetical protein